MASFHGEVELIQNWQSIEGNYSSVTANYYAVWDSGYAYSGYSSTASCTLDGITEDKTVTGFDLSSSNPRVLLGTVSKNVYHNNDGTKTVYASFTWASGNSYVGTLSGSASLTLTTIPRQATITRADNFNSNANPYMEFSNPGGFTCNLRLEFGGTSINRNGITGSGGYTFQLTTEERNLLYSKCPTSNTLTVRYVVATILNENETWWSISDRTMTVVNSNPVFSSYNFQDIKSESLTLTGNSSIFINNYNTLQVTIPTQYKATAQNGATMIRYRLICGNNTPVEQPYSETNDVVLTINNIKNRTFSLYAIDSRGNSTKVDKFVTASNWKDYSDIVITSGSATRTGGVSKETTLTFEATMWKTNNQYDFGAVSNEITQCQYKYKKTNESTYGTAISITPTVSSDVPARVTYNLAIRGDEGAEGFGLSNSYDIQIIIKDKIKTATYNVTLGIGAPLIAVAPTGVSFGLPYDTNISGSCQIDGSIAIGQDAIFAKAPRGGVTFTSTWSDVSVGTFTEQKSIGNKLSISNGKVKIGKGVNKIIAYAMNLGFYVSSLSGDKGFHVQKNGANEVEGSYYTNPQGGVLPLFTAIGLIDVQENDLIGVSVMSGVTGTLDVLESYLYVQVVE